MYTTDKNEWNGWMIFSRNGNQVGVIASSFSLSKAVVDATLKTRARQGEFIAPVTIIKED